MVARIRIGDYGDGTIGLKTSLPGYDVTVRADDQDREKRSFNTEWNNIVRVAMHGYAACTTVGAVTHGLGYVPFVDARKFDPLSNTVYDDMMVTNGGWIETAVAALPNSTNVAFSPPSSSLVPPSGFACYVIYKIQAA